MAELPDRDRCGATSLRQHTHDRFCARDQCRRGIARSPTRETAWLRLAGIARRLSNARGDLAGGCTRELLEETGCHLHPSSLKFVSIRTDEYNNNLIIARSQQPVSVECERDKESLDVYFSNEIGSQDDWAHRDLYEAAASLVAELD